MASIDIEHYGSIRIEHDEGVVEIDARNLDVIAPVQMFVEEAEALAAALDEAIAEAKDHRYEDEAVPSGMFGRNPDLGPIPSFDEAETSYEKDVTLFNAIYQERAVRFNYVKPRETQAELRVFSPWQFSTDDVITGYDHVRQEIRSFTVDRMSDVAESAVSFVNSEEYAATQAPPAPVVNPEPTFGYGILGN